MKIKPSKLQTVTRCSYCHADDGEMEKCSGCGTLLHPECEKENGKCPTLGCAKPVRSESLSGFYITGGTGGATGAGGNVQIVGGNGTGQLPQGTINHWYRGGTPRREGLYDTETWAPQNTTQQVAFSLAAWPTTVLHTNVNSLYTTTWTQTPVMNPYYITNYLDGILTRPLRDEFAEPTEPDPMNTTEQF